MIKKRKPESNGPHHRYSMGEAFTAILPTFLSTLVVTMLSGLVEKLQQMMARQDRVENIPQKRALEILRAGHQRLSERIHEMSKEEQFCYAYLIHSLTKSLVGYQGSLEQLEAAAETRMLVSLLVGIAHSPEEEGGREGRIGSDVLLAVVPVFSSMVREGGFVLVQNTTVLEAFEEFDAAFDFSVEFMSHALKYFPIKVYDLPVMESGGWSEALADKHEEEKADCEDEGTETEKLECLEDAPVENSDASIQPSVHRVNEIGQLLEGRTSSVAVFNGSEAKNEDRKKSNEISDHGMSAVYINLAVNMSEVSQLYRQLTVSHYAIGDESSTAVNVDALSVALCELDSRDIQATVPKEDQDVYMRFQKELFSVISLRVRKLNFFRHECRDGYKSVAHTDIDASSDVVVNSAAGSRWVSFDHSRQTIIEGGGSVEDALGYSAMLKSWLEEIQSTQSEHLIMRQPAGVIPSRFQHGYICSNPPPPPQPSPSTSWCWKRRLESVGNVQRYVRTASPATLEELDTECQETICHAIASEFPAVTLIQLLHNNVSPTLFAVQDKHGNTPLHCAAIAGNAVIAGELVVLCPSAVSVRNHNCLTPLDIALDHRNDEMVECLLRESMTSAHHNSSVIQLLESYLVKSLKNGYTHFLQLVLQLRTEHGLAIDFECTDSSGHTAWHYLKQATPAVRAVVARLLQESDLQQPLLGRLLKSLSTDTCQQSPLEISRDPAAIVHRDTTPPIQPKQRLPSTSDSEESDAHSTASIPESSKEDQGNVDSTTAATTFEDTKAPLNDGVDPPTEGAGDEEQSRVSITTEADAGPAQVEIEELIEHAPNTEGAASVSIALETPSELVDQKDVVTSTTSTTLVECDTQAHSEQTVSQPLQQASPPSDSVGGGVEPKQPLHTPLYSQEPQNDACDPSTRESTSDKEETVLPDGDREEKVDELVKDVNTAAETEGEKEREQFQVEPPLPATKPLAVVEPSLELALAEIRRQLKEEQDSAVAKLREEYKSLVAEKEKKLIAEVEKLKQANSELVTEVEELKRSRSSDDEHSQATSLSSTHSRPTSLSSNKSTHSLPTALSNSESTHSNSESTHSNSESTTDSSVHLPSTDTAHTEAILVLSDYTSAEDNRPLRYSQPYTDSVTSSPNDSSSPQKPSVPKSRRKQRRTTEERVSLYRPFSTSGSDNRESSKRQSQRSRDSKKARVKRSSYSECDSSRFSRNRPSTTSSSNTREPSRRRPHRSRDSVKARAKNGSFSEYEVSPPLSNDEHSTADSAVGDSLPCESTVDERPTLLPAPSSPRHRLAQLKSRKQQSEKRSSRKAKLVTLSTFFHASGEFNKKGFKTWVTKTVSKSSSYNYLRFIVHQQLFTVFGFSPMKVSLTAKERRLARAVLDFVRITKHPIPHRVENNLNALRNVLNSRQRENEAAEEVVLSSKRHETKTVDDTRTGEKDKAKEGARGRCDISKSKALKLQTHEKEQDHTTEDNGVCDSADPSPAQSQTWSTPTSEQSVGVSVLDFANPSNPLDVIHSHMKVYSQCCPRHTIKNTVVIGTAYPAADAFGPKRRYCTIKDLQSDPSHSQFDFSRQLSVRSSSNRHYQERKGHQHVFDRLSTERHNRGALPPQLLTPVVTQSLEETTPSSPAHLKHSSQLHTSTTSHTHHPSKPSEITAGPTHRETSTETRHSITVSRRLDVASTTRHTSLLDQHTIPEDHKERLRSTAELLHAQDYTRILHLVFEGEPPSSLPAQLSIPYTFITALAYYKLSNHKKSVQFFAQCLRMADECGRKGDITICNIYIGDIEFAKRRYTDAAGRYQTALEHYSRESVAQDFRMVMPTRSAVWLKCGSAFKNASKVGASVGAYEKAIEFASSKKDQLSAHTSLGNLYQGIGENGRAVKEYEAAIELAEELEDRVSLGWNHGNLGNALLGLHQRDKALHHLFKALDMAVEHETTPQAIGRAYNNLGTAFQSLNELAKAEEHYDLALAQAIYGNDIPGQARVYGNIGNLQMINKQYERAVPHYTEVMRLSQDKATITTAHHNRGCAYYDWGEKKKSQDTTHASGTWATTGIEIKGKLSRRMQPNDSDTAPPESHFRVSLHGPDFEYCEDIYRPRIMSPEVQKYYQQGTRDLEYVVKHHEENFSGIKGSPKGLSLSVSLFETNSRTFHRMQDCLVHLRKGDKDLPTRFEDALLVAEQSRARTLGELMLKRRGPQLRHLQLTSPPSLFEMKSIVARQSCPVVYLSYTGERLLGWLLHPTPDGECSINMFEVPLSDDEFDGKSLDYHLRYSLNEQLVEKSFEMYKPFDREKDKTEPLEKLYDLVARPVMTMLRALDQSEGDPVEGDGANDDRRYNRRNARKNKKSVRKIVIIPDSYTNLLPFTCVLDKESGEFWGDGFYFQIMPSLLTMGILDQLPTVSVPIPVQYQQMLCVVGNPNIPRFKFNNEEWDLGKLPHATREAEWVSHILQCNPILHEQATKDAVMMRIMNARVIHLATHGSAVAGFLAFAGISSSSNEAVDAKRVLIYPDEIETLNISPALVVLSSCDSGRGVFKADGIQGMARAFILSGAQAVLTALWRVPDESACIFMQFFYQYLVEGMRGTEALHKAILCLRCFSKYSQYIHWSGYQLTGREFQFNVSESSARAELTTRLGTSSVFPRLEVLKDLEKAFLNSPRFPTDVQVCITQYTITHTNLIKVY